MMLVITRRLNEAIKIGEEITISVTHIKNGVAKLGVIAPKDMKITRSDDKQELPSPINAAINTNS